MSRVRVSVFIALLTLLSPASYGQNWAGILAPTRAIDWSNAGVRGGIPNNTTICTTLNPGATAPQINSAIAACGSGKVVMLNAGTYNLSAGIVFNGKSGVTLRGAGADKTFLVFTNDGGCHGYAAAICVDSSDTNWPGGPSNSANWTAGYSKATTTITLSSVSNLKVGSPLMLDQVDDASDTGTKFVCQNPSTNPPCSLEGNNNNGARNNRDQEQIVQVTSISGNNVTITPGLYATNWSSGKSPGAWWANSPISSSGVESLSIDNTNSNGARGVEIFNCIDCWVSGVRGIRSARSHVEIMASARITVRDSYFYLTQNAVSQSYGVSPYGSTDVLVENVIFQYIATPLQINGCTGCVLSYNFAINNYYEGAVGYVMPAFMVHTAGDDLILLEGNVGSQTYADVFHGTHNLMTYFRNYFSGNQPACYNGQQFHFSPCNSHQIPIILQSYNRGFNLLGNVLGQAGLEQSYENGTKPIYDLGGGNTEGNVTVNGDPLVVTTLMRWGNYDTVTGGVRFLGSEVPSGLSNYANPVPPSQTLPDSFYLSGKPAWWPAGKAWPPIGPDVTGGNIAGVGGHAYTIPAQDCYLNVMAGPADGTGNVLSFNADTCYSTTQIDPPSGLQATPH